jgi:thiamine-phosphate pyrophosphorylase
MFPMRPLEERQARLRDARLYLVTEPNPGGRPTEALLSEALAGGVDIVQLRDKGASDEEVLRAAPAFRELCDRFGALFIVNDRPDLARAVAADGVHVGQADTPPEQAREGGLLVGLSTHSPEQFDAALDSAVDYLCAGPVWETPTKEGRPATGLGLLRHAATRDAAKPWFAIGGIDTGNVSEVTAAGAERVVVVRAVRDADDPRAAAAELRAALEREVGVGHA